jgi:OPT oligopeptide transporter protein
MRSLTCRIRYYNINPSPGVGIFVILSTQMLGYGVAGLLRKTLVYPSNMLYPSNLPTASLLENLHRDRKNTEKKMKVFYIAFVVLFVWQVFPQYISKFSETFLLSLHANNHSAASCWCVSVLSKPSKKSFGYKSFWRIYG